MRYLSTRDVMTRTPVVVGPEASLEECAKLMIKEKVGSLIVKENNILKGIITEKDFIEKVVLKAINTKATPVRKIMTTNVITIDDDKDIMEAIRVMIEHNVRRLPVVKDNNLTGLLTVKDILRIEPQLFDLIIEKSNFLRSREYKGECEKCGVVSSLTRQNGKYLCRECNKIESVINY